MSNKFSFRGGIHPPHGKKQTNKVPLSIYPTPKKVNIPMMMHIGAPAKVIVKKGDKVVAGQRIGDPSGFVSSPVYASISGEVTAITEITHPSGKLVPAIEITNDNSGECTTLEPFSNWKLSDTKELLSRIQETGITGLGGASFPTHVKLSPPPEMSIDTLIINGAECEPYLTADHRLLLEWTKEFVTGVEITQKILGTDNCFIGIEKNKPDAIAAVRKCLKDNNITSIIVAPLEVKYPQGGEKQLIQAITKRQVPSGKLPMEAGCVVINTATSYAIFNAIVNGIPFYSRVVTVTGPLVNEPQNLVIPLGTSVREVLDHCKCDITKASKVLMGGPMMGLALPSLDVPIIKSTSGILPLKEITTSENEFNCINCGACVIACPIHLVPSHFSKLVKKNEYKQCEEVNILDCIECGSCSYECPSKINLVHYIRLGKKQIILARNNSK